MHHILENRRYRSPHNDEAGARHAPPVWRAPAGPRGLAVKQRQCTTTTHQTPSTTCRQCGARWRGRRAYPGKSHMQFDWVTIQLSLKTLKFQRCNFKFYSSRRGIACDIDCGRSDEAAQRLRAKWAWSSNAQRTPRATSVEGADGPAGPGRASSRRAERSSRRGRRAGGRAQRCPEHRWRSQQEHRWRRLGLIDKRLGPGT